MNFAEMTTLFLLFLHQFRLILVILGQMVLRTGEDWVLLMQHVQMGKHRVLWTL